jgi:hypothetical protein
LSEDRGSRRAVRRSARRPEGLRLLFLLIGWRSRASKSTSRRLRRSLARESALTSWSRGRACVGPGRCRSADQHTPESDLPRKLGGDDSSKRSARPRPGMRRTPEGVRSSKTPPPSTAQTNNAHQARSCSLPSAIVSLEVRTWPRRLLDHVARGVLSFVSNSQHRQSVPQPAHGELTRPVTRRPHPCLGADRDLDETQSCFLSCRTR